MDAIVTQHYRREQSRPSSRTWSIATSVPKVCCGRACSRASSGNRFGGLPRRGRVVERDRPPFEPPFLKDFSEPQPTSPNESNSAPFSRCCAGAGILRSSHRPGLAQRVFQHQLQGRPNLAPIDYPAEATCARAVSRSDPKQKPAVAGGFSLGDRLCPDQGQSCRGRTLRVAAAGVVARRPQGY
jgi:hypothetical protein